MYNYNGQYMANINVKSEHQLVGIEYSGDKPMLIFKSKSGEIHFEKLQRGVLRLDKEQSNFFYCSLIERTDKSN